MSVTNKSLHNHHLFRYLARLFFLLAVILGMICHAYAGPKCKYSILVYGKDGDGNVSYYPIDKPGVIFSAPEFKDIRISGSGEPMEFLLAFIQIQPHLQLPNADLPLEPIEDVAILSKHPVCIAQQYASSFKLPTRLLCNNPDCQSIPYIIDTDHSDESAHYAHLQVSENIPLYDKGARLCYMCVRNMDQQMLAKKMAPDVVAQKQWIKYIQPYVAKGAKIFSCPCDHVTASAQHEIMKSNHLVTCNNLLLQCNLCKHSPGKKREQFKSISALEDHINNEHNEYLIEKGLTCHHCHTKYYSMGDLLEHKSSCPHCHKQVRCAIFNEHSECCTRPCEFQGCTFYGTSKEMEAHEIDPKSMAIHLGCLNSKLCKVASEQTANSHSQNTAFSHANSSYDMDRLQKEVRDLSISFRQMDEDVQAHRMQIQEVQKAQETSENNVEAEDMEIAVEELTKEFARMKHEVQMLQETDYGYNKIWVLHNVSHFINKSRQPNSKSLICVPFMTSKHGYKMALQVHLNGDNHKNCRGTYISFFIIIMRGDFDFSLPWPYKQRTTLMLMSQNKSLADDIVYPFKPSDNIKCYGRPTTDQNVAIGCQQFCSIEVLNHIAYVQDDTMFFRCLVDKKGLEHID